MILFSWYKEMPDKLLIDQSAKKIKLYENPKYLAYLPSKPNIVNPTIVQYDKHLKTYHKNRRLNPKIWLKQNIALYNDGVEK